MHFFVQNYLKNKKKNPSFFFPICLLQMLKLFQQKKKTKKIRICGQLLKSNDKNKMLSSKSTIMPLWLSANGYHKRWHWWLAKRTCPMLEHSTDKCHHLVQHENMELTTFGHHLLEHRLLVRLENKDTIMVTCEINGV